eukprot:1157662-Pelagomonas_calceolata.AAC.2
MDRLGHAAPAAAAQAVAAAAPPERSGRVQEGKNGMRAITKHLSLPTRDVSQALQAFYFYRQRSPWMLCT